MSKDEGILCFGAIPFRALRDKRLVGVPIVVLGIIAAHDRFGRNGQGCTASQGRLAELAGCRRETINAAITLLDQLEYIVCGLNAKTGRRQSYSVVYNNADDNAAFRTADPADKLRPKRSNSCAPERASPEVEARPPRRTIPTRSCAPERTKSQQGCAQEPTCETTVEHCDYHENAADFQSAPQREYIPLSGNILSLSSELPMTHEAGPAPADPGRQDDPTAIPNRSLQNANERLWARHGLPKLTSNLGLRGRRQPAFPSCDPSEESRCTQ
jgi:hypothetical protein